MLDADMTKDQLIIELHELRRRVAESEKDQAEHKREEAALAESEERFKFFCEQAPLAYQSLDENGLIREIHCIGNDITERKLVADDLKQTNSYLENILENSPDAIGIVDNCGRFIRWNKMAEEVCGYSFEEMKGKSAFDLYADKDELEKMLVSLRREDSVKKWEMRLERKDGSIGSFEISIGLLKDSQNGSLGSVCVARDLSGIKETLAALRTSNYQLNREIFERKRSEEALAASEEMFRLLVESAPDAILVQTRGLWAYANPEAMKLFRAGSKDQLIGKPVTDTIHPGDRETVRARIHGANEQKKRVPAREQKYIVLDGAIVDVETSAVPIRYENEDGALVFVRDITERKRAEEALRKSETRLSLAVDQAGMGTSDADLLTGKSVWSESFFRLLGYEPRPGGEATTEMWWSRVHPEDRDRVSSLRERERVEHSSHMREYRVIRADTNEVVWLSAFARYLYDENGEAVRHIGIIFDSTVRKHMEDKLRRSNKELDLTIQVLSEKTQNLEEINAALRVLLRQREEDKKELGESVVANVRNLILPYTEKLKQSPLSSVQMIWMKLLESHINEITSSFGRTLAAQYANLTSTEIRIATLVRDGRSTARIAELSGISEKTVCRHRDNIRKKLGLRRGGINLRTHLLSLQ